MNIKSLTSKTLSVLQITVQSLDETCVRKKRHSISVVNINFNQFCIQLFYHAKFVCNFKTVKINSIDMRILTFILDSKIRMQKSGRRK